jgi:hypothetical protein
LWDSIFQLFPFLELVIWILILSFYKGR